MQTTIILSDDMQTYHANKMLHMTTSNTKRTMYVYLTCGSAPIKHTCLKIADAAYALTQTKQTGLWTVFQQMQITKTF